MRKERKHFLPKYFPIIEKHLFNSCDEFILPRFFKFVNKDEEFDKSITAALTLYDAKTKILGAK